MIRKVLVIRLGSIGDIVLTTPVLRALKGGFPKAKICTIVKGEYVQILEGNPHVDEIITVDTRGEHKGFWRLVRLAKALRREGFDLVVDLHANLRSLLISSLVGGRRKIRYRKRWLQRRAMVYLKGFPVKSRHTVDLYLETLRPLGIEAIHRLPEVSLADEDFRFAQGLLNAEGAKGGELLIGINPGAKWPTKRWTAEGFSALGDLLIEKYGARVIVFRDGTNSRFVAQVLSGMAHRPITPPERLSLGQLTALIGNCRLLVTNDSGPMHLAVGRGVPVVAMFGPTHPKLGFFPLGERDIVLSKELNCSPCSLHGRRKCHKGVRECMELITVDEVISAVDGILAGERQGRVPSQASGGRRGVTSSRLSGPGRDHK